MSAKHTPGPWDASGLIVYDTCMDGVASVHTAADAILIAAAPEMLDALRYARRFLNAQDHDTSYIDGVIAKAEGRS